MTQPLIPMECRLTLLGKVMDLVLNKVTLGGGFGEGRYTADITFLRERNEIYWVISVIKDHDLVKIHEVVAPAKSPFYGQLTLDEDKFATIVCK